MNESPSFEEALNELEAIVQGLERGDLPLEVALEQFERGIRLVRFCSQALDRMALQVEQLVVDESGTVLVEPFEPPEEPKKENSPL